MDSIQLTHTMPGWTDQKLRVTGVSYMENRIVGITAVEEHLDLYDDVYDVTSHTWYTTNLPNILGAVASVINVSRTEVVYYYRERSFTRLKIDFDPPAAATYPWWDYAEIWVSIGGSSDYRYMAKSTRDYVLDPVNEGVIYYVKIRSVSVSGAKEDFDSCYTISKNIVGRTDVPSDLSAMTAVANGDSVSIYAEGITDPDVEAYETRLGTFWGGALFLRLTKNCTLSFNGVRPGTHTFWISPVDNAGRYSTNPVSATVLVFLPPSYTLLATYGTWTWDFSAGSFINTEQYTDGSSVDWLRLITFENRLSDGGFENGDFTGWTVQADSVIESTIKNTGSYGSKLVASGSNASGCYYKYEINPFACYRFTQWVRMAVYTTGAFHLVKLQFYTDGDAYITNTSINHPGTPLDTWEEFEKTIGPPGAGMDFTIPVNAKFVRVYAGAWWNASGNPVGTAYIDDCYFEVLTAQAIKYGGCEFADPAMWNVAILSSRGTHVRSTAQADTGIYSMLYTGNGVDTGQHHLNFHLAGKTCPWGQNYELKASLYIPNGNTELTTFRIQWQITNKNGNVSYGYGSGVSTQGSWLDLSEITDLDENESLSVFYVIESQAQISSETFYVDNFQAKQLNPRVGKWISPTHDLNAIENVRVWGNFVTDFASSENTFGGVMGTTGTFGDHGADTKTFGEIFAATVAPKLNAFLRHGEAAVNEEVKEYFELLSADVKAKYVGVDVVITNPSNDARLSLEELDMLAYEGPIEV